MRLNLQELAVMDEALIRTVEEDLKLDEGWVPHAYDDANGRAVTAIGWVTLGYGFMVDERRQGGIPRAVADFWLRWEVKRLISRLEAEIRWFKDAPLSVRAGLVNMAYQMGVGGLLSFRRTLAHGAKGEWSQMAQEALRSRWAEQTPNRAARVAGMLGADHEA